MKRLKKKPPTANRTIKLATFEANAIDVILKMIWPNFHTFHTDGIVYLFRKSFVCLREYKITLNAEVSLFFCHITNDVLCLSMLFAGGNALALLEKLSEPLPPLEHWIQKARNFTHRKNTDVHR